MCELARNLLAEKLVDDFYEEDVRHVGQEEVNKGDLTERLKALLPRDQHELLYRWEAECAVTSGAELRRFADFVASMLVACHFGDEGECESTTLATIQR